MKEAKLTGKIVIKDFSCWEKGKKYKTLKVPSHRKKGKGNSILEK
jgi:hypothetical protein